MIHQYIRVLLIQLAALIILSHPVISHAYSFTVSGDGSYVEIGWTDGVGNRLGKPLFDGVLKEGQSVSRSTNHPKVQDHYTVVTDVSHRSTGDIFFGGSAMRDIPVMNVSIPLLLHSDKQGLVNIFYVVDVNKWIEGEGTYQNNIVYSDFNDDGTHPLLPGYTVGFSTDMNLDFEEAFNVNTMTGEVNFNKAQPFDQLMGSLTGSSKLVTASDEPADNNIDVSFKTDSLFPLRDVVDIKVNQLQLPDLTSFETSQDAKLSRSIDDNRDSRLVIPTFNALGGTVGDGGDLQSFSKNTTTAISSPVSQCGVQNIVVKKSSTAEGNLRIWAIRNAETQAADDADQLFLNQLGELVCPADCNTKDSDRDDNWFVITDSDAWSWTQGLLGYTGTAEWTGKWTFECKKQAVPDQ